jgi:hypothetical protein
MISAAAAQAPAESTTAPGIDVINTSWVAVGVGRDEAEAATLRGDTVGNRGGIEPTSFRDPVHQADVSVELKNVGQRAIKAISLDLVFLDAITKKEILRYRLNQKNDLGPGETVTLKKRINESEKGYY